MFWNVQCPEEDSILNRSKETADPLIKSFEDYVDYLSEESNFTSVAMLFIVFLVLLGSASISSSVAESKRRNPYVSFIGGLCVPFVFPMIALFMPKRKIKTAEDQISEAAEDEEDHFEEGLPPIERAPKSTDRATYLGDGPEYVSIDEGTASSSAVFTQQYFKGVMKDELGNFRGPFSMVVDGLELRVERIIDAMDDVISIETINADGKQQKLRLPYKKIESCREL